MRIGIDIDGVLTDIERFIIDYGTKFRYDNNVTTKMNIEEYYEEKALGLNPIQSERFWNEYLEFYAINYPVRSHASEVIRELHKNNHEIYIVTARNDEGLPPESYGTMKKMVNEWLLDNDILYDKLVYTNGSKLPYCIENKIDVMIEDAPFNVVDIAKEIPVLCFDNSYNKSVEGENIIRVYSWYDVLSKIENITN